MTMLPYTILCSDKKTLQWVGSNINDYYALCNKTDCPEASEPHYHEKWVLS